MHLQSGGKVINNLFKIKKISDLTQVCVLPVMILSIFLSFYLYIDMGKIKDKSQELVNNAIPHVLSAQQGAINLVHLKRNVETMTSSLDLQIARKAYVNTHILVSESVFAKSDYLQQKGSSLLQDVNRLWKLRLQLDELRATVNSSLNHMDALMYLIYNEQPMLFPELDSHVSNYTDIYKQSGNIRDLKGQHEFYYRLMLERLSEDFNQSAFLKEQIRLRNEQANGRSTTTNAFDQATSRTGAVTPSTNTMAANTMAGSVAGNQYISEEDVQKANRIFDNNLSPQNDVLTSMGFDVKPDAPNSNFFEGNAHLAKTNPAISEPSTSTNTSTFEDRQSEYASSVEPTEHSQQASKSVGDLPRSAVTSASAASSLSVGADTSAAGTTSNIATSMPAKSHVSNEFTVTTSKNIDDELLDQLANDKVEIAIENIQERHSDPIFFKSREQDLKLLALYKSELDRFDTLWSLFTKLQTVFVYDTTNLSNEIDVLSHSFTSGETAILHGELSDISHLAAQIKPMVMMTVGFSLVSFWIVIFLLNRYIIRPLKNIACILIVFRRTKRVNLKQHEAFFEQEHVMEIREIIDILPQLFDEFSNIEKKSTDLKLRYKQLLETSKYDALTKVLNRGTLNLLVKTMGANTPANFAVLMVDIDYFKNLNDSMGHQRGDEVLFAVAQTLQSNLAKKDFVFRYGGEEFCVVLSDISPSNAFKVAERLCTTIRKLALINNGVPSGLVTVSIGISLVTKSNNQFRVDELISQADKALYLAKRNGRNQVVACPRAMVFGMSEDGGAGADDPNLPDEAIPDASDDLNDAEENHQTEGSEQGDSLGHVANLIGHDVVAVAGDVASQDAPAESAQSQSQNQNQSSEVPSTSYHSTLAEDESSRTAKGLDLTGDGVGSGAAATTSTASTTGTVSTATNTAAPAQDGQGTGDGKEPVKSTSDVILAALKGPVEELNESDPNDLTQNLPEAYHKDGDPLEAEAAAETNAAAEPHQGTEAAKPAEQGTASEEKAVDYNSRNRKVPGMMNVDSFDHYAERHKKKLQGGEQGSKSIWDRLHGKSDKHEASVESGAQGSAHEPAQNSESKVEPATNEGSVVTGESDPQSSQAKGQGSIGIGSYSHASAAAPTAPAAVAPASAPAAPVAPATAAPAPAADNKAEPEQQEYELVVTLDESGNVHEYFIGEQDGPIDLTAKANAEKNKLTKSNESDKSEQKDADQEAQDKPKNAAESAPRPLLFEMIDKVNPKRWVSSGSNNIVLTQGNEESKVVIDRGLVAAMAAANPDQGITEDPFASEDSMVGMNSSQSYVPSLLDTDTFFPGYVCDENEYNPSQAIVTEDENQERINSRLRYETAGSPFFLRNDVNATDRQQSQWSLASLFGGKKKKQEDEPSSADDAAQGASQAHDVEDAAVPSESGESTKRTAPATPEADQSAVTQDTASVLGDDDPVQDSEDHKPKNAVELTMQNIVDTPDHELVSKLNDKLEAEKQEASDKEPDIVNK